MFQYFAFYKPYQVLSQFSAEGDKKTLKDFFPQAAKDIYPVGRLDYDSEGLLILTNDKTLTYRMLDPKFAHPRTYWVQVEGIATPAQLDALRKGVTITINGKAHKTNRATADLIQPEPDVPERNPPIRFRKSVPTCWISLTLTEGKNRQVRRMTAAVGLPTLRLIRYSIGKLTINDMQPGSHEQFDERIRGLLLAHKG